MQSMVWLLKQNTIFSMTTGRVFQHGCLRNEKQRMQWVTLLTICNLKLQNVFSISCEAFLQSTLMCMFLNCGKNPANPRSLKRSVKKQFAIQPPKVPLSRRLTSSASTINKDKQMKSWPPQIDTQHDAGFCASQTYCDMLGFQLWTLNWITTQLIFRA